MIMYFSCKHKLYFFVWLEYPLHFLIIFHDKAKSILEFFNFQMDLLTAVLFLCLGFRNEFAWLFYHVLNAPSVIPRTFGLPGYHFFLPLLDEQLPWFGTSQVMGRCLCCGNCSCPLRLCWVGFR